MAAVDTLRHALRALLRHRRSNAAIVTTLALLAAIVLALWSLAHNVMVAPWTYDSERLGVMRHGIAGAELQSYGFAPDEYRAIAQSGLFEATSASQSSNVAFGDGSAAARPLRLVRTTPSALAVSDGRALLGRFVQPADVGVDDPIVISYRLWHAEFAGRDDILGRHLQLDGRQHTIVGVMPPRFHYLGGDLWSAHRVDPSFDTATAPSLVVNFKLRPGGSIAAIAAPLDALIATLPRRADRARYPTGWALSPLLVIDAVSGPLRPALLLLVSGALAMFLLGVLNVAALLVARQLTDASLLATRMALGESRARAIATLALESLLLAALAMLIAAAVGRGLFDLFVSMLSVEWIPRELESNFAYVGPALWTLPLSAALLATGLILARLPAVLRSDARACISGSPRSGGHPGERRALGLLSSVQIAIATAISLATLAIGAGADALAARDLGYRTDAALHVQLVFPADRYADAAARIAVLDRLQQSLPRDSAATAVGYMDSAPLQRYSRSGSISTWSGPQLAEPLAVDYRAVHGDLGAALGLQLLEGRLPEIARDRTDGEPIVVITQSLARMLAPDGSALGRTLVVASGALPPVERRVVGVIADVLHESPLSAARPTLLVPFAQEPTPAAAAGGGSMSALLRFRTTAAASAAMRTLPAAVGRIDPWIALHDVGTLEARAERMVAGVSLARRLFAVFALLGVGLATMGVAAVASLGIKRRQHELAVRSAIGAAPRGLLVLVLRSSLRSTVIASIVGAIVAAMLIEALAGALQGVPALRAPHLIAIPLVLIACSLAATWLPARRAAQAQPNSLLRPRH